MSVYLKTDFENHLRTKITVPEGFTFNWPEQVWEKDMGSYHIYIYIGYEGNEPSGYYIRNMGLNLKFNEVEDLIQPVCSQYNLFHTGEYTIKFKMGHLTNINWDIVNGYNRIEINDEASFDTVAVEMQKIIDTGIIPLINQYQTIESIADFLVDKQFPDEVESYILGPIVTLKSMAIFKLAYETTNNALYIQKRDEYYNIIVENLPNIPELEPYKLAFEDLFPEGVIS